MRRPAGPALALALLGCATQEARPAASLPPSVVQHTLETKPAGAVVSWQGVDGREQGTVMPVRTFRTRQGYCREYQVTVAGPGAAEQASWREVACRDAAGTWRDPEIGA